jgi:hypothetical protein
MATALTAAQTEAVISHARLDRSRAHFRRQISLAVHHGSHGQPCFCLLCVAVANLIDGALGEGYLACLADGRHGEDATAARSALTEIDRRR